MSNGTVIVQPPARTICKVLQTFQNDLTTAPQPKWFCRDLFQHRGAGNEGGRKKAPEVCASCPLLQVCDGGDGSRGLMLQPPHRGVIPFGGREAQCAECFWKSLNLELQGHLYDYLRGFLFTRGHLLHDCRKEGEHGATRFLHRCHGDLTKKKTVTGI